MKYITLLLLVSMLCQCKGKETKLNALTIDTTTSGFYSIEISKKQPQIDSICAERGHVVPYDENVILTGGDFQTYTEVVDTPDSSYLVEMPYVKWQVCARCGQQFPIPRKGKYIKTIWKKKGGK